MFPCWEAGPAVILYVYQCGQCGDITPTVVLAQVPGLRGEGAIPMCRHAGGDFPMTRVADTAKVVLPFDGPEGFAIAPMKVGNLHRAGILIPETQNALEWLYRHRQSNGMAEAFLVVGGRRCIDLVAFARLMRGKRA